MKIQRKGGGADEYIRGFNIVNAVRNVSYCFACLHGQAEKLIGFLSIKNAYPVGTQDRRASIKR